MADDTKMTREPKMYWRDKDIEELTREELIVALRQSYKMYQSSSDDHRRTLNMWDLCRNAGRP